MILFEVSSFGLLSVASLSFCLLTYLPYISSNDKVGVTKNQQKSLLTYENPVISRTLAKQIIQNA